MNKLIIVALSLALAIIGILTLRTPKPRDNPLNLSQSMVSSCPAGSYAIGYKDNGDVICKVAPTGCPYGDSIPKDSPKCVAPKAATPLPEETPYWPKGWEK